MHNSELRQERLPLSDLVLDPNNPRFPDRKANVPGKRFVDIDVQAKAMQRISEFGISELTNSILRNGFLPLDRIVVKEILEHPSKYVVVEGNRRLAALKKVITTIEEGEVEAEDLDDDYLNALKESLVTIECLIYTGSDIDIAWILQGVRHLSGIRDWSPSQKAELIAKEINDRNLKYKAVGEALGMTAQQVGKYYRAHCALQQMRRDPDYGDRYDSSLFTLFDEAYSKMAVRKWLDWSETDKEFKNADHLQRFYSWITRDPEYNNERRIHDPRQMKTLAKLVNPAHVHLLDQVDDGDLTLEQAEVRAEGEPQEIDWRVHLRDASSALSRIPITLLQDNPQELAAALKKLRDQVSDLHQKAESAAEQNP